MFSVYKLVNLSKQFSIVAIFKLVLVVIGFELIQYCLILIALFLENLFIDFKTSRSPLPFSISFLPLLSTQIVSVPGRMRTQSRRDTEPDVITISMYSNDKDPVYSYNRLGAVKRIPCNERDATYICETGRSFILDVKNIKKQLGLMVLATIS